MLTILPTNYIEYVTQDDKYKLRYKRVNTNNPLEIKYEDGLLKFKMIKMLDITKDNKVYHLILKKDENSYAFGEVDTIDNILKRINQGEKFYEDYKKLLEEYSGENYRKHTFHITGRKKLEFDIYTNYIPAIIDVQNKLSPDPDSNIEIESLIELELIWYIEYKKQNDEALYYKPTFCSDKKFRYEKGIENYRFVQVTRFNIDDQEYNAIVHKEEKTYTPNIENEVNEVDLAIDGAVQLIFSEKNEKKELFKGYTRIYPFNTEDSSSVFRKHQEYVYNQDALTVTGSGDAALDLFLNGANSVTCFDANGLAKYYAKLKFYAIKSGLSYDDFIKFFAGERIGDSIFEFEIYKKFCESLGRDTRRFWDAIYKYLNVNDRKIYNNKNDIVYNINDFLGPSKKTFGNPCSYSEPENYKKLQNLLINKDDKDIHFVDSPLFSVNKELLNIKYNYIYLSNIIDFTSLFINEDNIRDRMVVFKNFITNNLRSYLTDYGLIDVGFLDNNWRIGEDQLILSGYQTIFLNRENFKIENLLPLNTKDSVLVFKNMEYVKQENIAGKSI